MREVNSTAIRTLEVLDYLCAAGKPSPLKDIAAAVGLPLTTTNRILNSLVATGYAQQNLINRYYGYGWKVALFGGVAPQELRLVDNIRPFLRDLADHVGHAIKLAVLQNDSVLLLDCVLPVRTSGAHYTSPGTQLSAHATALGKALLTYLPRNDAETTLQRLNLTAHTPNTITDLPRLRAALEEVRRQAYAIDRREQNPHMSCIAVPIRDASGVAVAAISVSLTDSELSSKCVAEIAPSLQNGAKKIELSLFRGTANR